MSPDEVLALSLVIARQQMAIANLEAQLAQAATRIRELEEGGVPDAPVPS